MVTMKKPYSELINKIYNRLKSGNFKNTSTELVYYNQPSNTIQFNEISISYFIFSGYIKISRGGLTVLKYDKSLDYVYLYKTCTRINKISKVQNEDDRFLMDLCGDYIITDEDLNKLNFIHSIFTKE